MVWNGMEWNGTERNGMEWSGKYVCMHAWMYVCMYLCMFTYVCILLDIYIYTSFISIYIRFLQVKSFMYVYIYMYIYIMLLFDYLFHSCDLDRYWWSLRFYIIYPWQPLQFQSFQSKACGGGLLFCSLVVLDSCGFGMRASCGNLIDSSLVKLWGLGNNRLRLLASQLLDLIHLLDFKFLHVPRWKNI